VEITHEQSELLQKVEQCQDRLMPMLRLTGLSLARWLVRLSLMRRTADRSLGAGVDATFLHAPIIANRFYGTRNNFIYTWYIIIYGKIAKREWRMRFILPIR